jgi:predicted ester cyclase
MVVFEVTWTGTHKGPLQTPKGAIPATGKKIDVRACIVHEIAGDKVKEERHYFDLMTLLQQIGVAS